MPGFEEGAPATRHSLSRYRHLVRLLILAAYAGRPLSCMVALGMEDRASGASYGSIDPHGFGVLGAIGASVLCAPLALPLLLRSRVGYSPIAERSFWMRMIAVTLVLGSPMLIQMSYLALTLPVSSRWDFSLTVMASSILWLAVVVGVYFTRAAGMPSIHAAFERAPRTSWASIAILAAVKGTLLGLALAG